MEKKYWFYSRETCHAAIYLFIYLGIQVTTNSEGALIASQENNIKLIMSLLFVIKRSLHNNALR